MEKELIGDDKLFGETRSYIYEQFKEKIITYEIYKQNKMPNLEEKLAAVFIYWLSLLDYFRNEIIDQTEKKLILDTYKSYRTQAKNSKGEGREKYSTDWLKEFKKFNKLEKKYYKFLQTTGKEIFDQDNKK